MKVQPLHAAHILTAHVSSGCLGSMAQRRTAVERVETAACVLDGIREGVRFAWAHKRKPSAVGLAKGALGMARPADRPGERAVLGGLQGGFLQFGCTCCAGVVG